MVTKFHVGVDPGKQPAASLLDSEGNIIRNVMIKSKDTFPYSEWFNLIREFDDECSWVHCEEVMHVVCELPHSVFGASAKSNFTFGLSVGATIQGLTTIWDVDTVRPKDWQKEIIIPSDIVKVDGKKDTKATAEKAARRILGDKWKDEHFLPTTRSSVINHNMIDSYLLSYYCYIKNKDND